MKNFWEALKDFWDDCGSVIVMIIIAIIILISIAVLIEIQSAKVSSRIFNDKYNTNYSTSEWFWGCGIIESMVEGTKHRIDLE